MPIYLMRHGETLWNTQKILQGRMDSPLTAQGVAQAEAFGRTLARIGLDHAAVDLVSSPLGRAWQTATLAVSAWGGDPALIRHEERIIEHAFGAWEGCTWPDLERDHAETVKARLSDRWNAGVPGGESFADVAARARPWMEEADAAERPVVAFSHGVTSRVLRGLYAGLPPEETVRLKEPQEVVFILAGGRIEEVPTDL